MSKLAFLFPGQGSQYVGMGKAMYDRYPLVKQIFQEAEYTLGYNVAKMCFQGNIEELSKTEITQPAILTVSYAAFQVYMKEIGINPEFCAGHSLGEYSALTCSGVLKFSDALEIVSLRGKLMQEAAAISGGMMAVVHGMEVEHIRKICKSISERKNSLICIACYNSPKQVAVSLQDNVFEIFKVEIENLRGKVIPIKVSVPSHSPIMYGAAYKLKEALKGYKYNNFKWPVISNVTGKPYMKTEDMDIIYNLTAQMTNPVMWQQSINYIKDQSIHICVDMGPGTILKNLTRQITSDITVHSFESIENFETLRKNFLLNIYNEEKSTALKLIDRCLAAAICTENNNWNSTEYYKGVIIPYRQIKKMREDIEKSACKSNLEKVEEALDMLKMVFDTKKVPVEERKERLNEIFNEINMKQISSYVIKS
ncbi:ACP S-malonyltransferase [Clostridium kluyveri]|uniref:[acyl-carrier-protein] S-malonyltransferase n=1 Tax=Clostridium kluyveri TaxID=1534 RepID=A0A1L5F9I4_CLOKL|nr:ACP S-malonyltransferase [Clostridium kluyveri]APM39627.1 [acyl-carrier-protein] S-malonyltransferase [Clostridium kluyveri]